MRGRFTLVVALVLTSAPLSAQTLDSVTATQLFDQGREALRLGDYPSAVAKLIESARLDPKVGTLMNLAEAEARLGLLASSHQHFRRASELAASTEDPLNRAPIARARMATIEPHIPRLTIRLLGSAPPDSHVTRDGVEIGAAGLGVSLALDPGVHIVVANAPGRTAKTYSVVLAGDDHKELDVEPEPLAGAAPASPAPPAPTLSEAPRGRADPGVRAAGFVVGGAGIVALGLGTYFGLRARARYDDARAGCDAQLRCGDEAIAGRAEASHLATTSTIAFVAGGVLVATGVALVMFAPRTRTPVTLSVAPRGVFASGAW